MLAYLSAAVIDSSRPVALADVRGRIAYVGQRDGAENSPAVSGTLVLDGSNWHLDERSGSYALHLDGFGSAITQDGKMYAVDDVFETEMLANAWAAVLGSMSALSLARSGSDGSWSADSGVRAYLAADGAKIVGIVDAQGRDGMSFAMDDWTAVGPFQAPRKILRLRGGVPEASYSISHYSFAPFIDAPHGQGHATAMSIGTLDDQRRVLLNSFTPIRLASEILALFGLLAAGLCAVIWFRRDAFVAAACRLAAKDPRGWRRAGVSLFVEPDGALTVDGLRYRVGPHFYGRAVLVQQSALFLRVSCPAVPRAAIVARRFRAPARRSAAGFSLVEAIVATVMFATVVPLGVYPAMIALSHAQQVAQQKTLAVQIASNALADEEAAYAYAAGAPSGTTTNTIDGLTLKVTVNPGFARYLDDLEINVSDADGNELARVTSALGPQVALPPSPGQ
jgi:type II secretory pathway pseudopilin PulG